MKIFQKFFLILVTFCLFFNVTLSRTWNADFTQNPSEENSFLKYTHLKKSNIFIDFDIDKSIEESLQEESDTDDTEFNCIACNPFEFSFDSFINNQKLLFLVNQSRSTLKLPLFLKFQNLRL